jgi:hypothetical protein
VFARVKQSRNGEYLQIVESYRDEGRVRQRMVLYVGHYNSVADALERMPKDERLQALRALVGEHPELLERDRKRAARRVQREREPRVSAERSDQQRELREKVGDPGVEIEMLRKRRNRLRAAARRRFRRVDDVQAAAYLQGYTLTDDDWRKIEEILEKAEHLSEEADELNAELKRRR